MEINGNDYTLQAIILLTVMILFLLQYVLCKKSERKWVRAIPFLAPAAALLGAIWFIIQPKGGFIDFSTLAAVLCGIFAVICLVPIVIARIVCRRKKKRRRTGGNCE